MVLSITITRLFLGHDRSLFRPGPQAPVVPAVGGQTGGRQGEPGTLQPFQGQAFTLS